MLIRAVSSKDDIMPLNKANRLWRFLGCHKRTCMDIKRTALLLFCFCNIFILPNFLLSSFSVPLLGRRLRWNNGSGWITWYNTYSWHWRSSWVDPLVQNTTKVASTPLLSSLLPILPPCLLQFFCFFLLNYLFEIPPLFKPLSFSHVEPINRQNEATFLAEERTEVRRKQHFSV